ncbi:hypothetical protein CHS0354_022777 [Potamilus streckersoni]|uniref:OTU domain-containing protein n=1 Tax=Potamilus streckersoni TaxID=2493646 RepID=A0AAE0S1Z5_9BIVA|nr:hypothetical protein CHS0354_022777 [Potamilus streckersoni]
MSARGIQNGRQQLLLVPAGLRQDTVTKKREERAIREAYRHEKRINSYLSEDENCPQFSLQLKKMGLELRDIPGDGNCLFRALGDQMDGHVRDHYKHRQDVVRYMMEHRSDFEPFLDESVTFERHIGHIRQIGTYVGNDAIVAFARLHQVSIVIHQLSAPFLLIQGCQNPKAKQLHIAYHNGDHYSSVRRVNDNTESPANIRIEVKDHRDSTHSSLEHKNGYMKDGVVRAVRDTDRLTEEVRQATGCDDEERILYTLLDSSYDVDAAIAIILQEMETVNGATYETSQQTFTDSGIFIDGASSQGHVTQTAVDHGSKGHFRESSLGGSSGYGSISSHNGGARSKLPIATKSTGKISSKQKKEIKKLEKKKRAEERHRQKFLGGKPQQLSSDDEESVLTVITRDLQIAKI